MKISLTLLFNFWPVGLNVLH